MREWKEKWENREWDWERTTTQSLEKNIGRWGWSKEKCKRRGQKKKKKVKIGEKKKKK